MTKKGDPYGSERISSGIRYFLLGKAVTSVAGVGTLLLVVRGLPIEHFAAYSILFGLVDVLLVLTSVGTSQILTRFIPELFARHFQHALRELLAYALGLRFAVLLLCLAALALLTGPFAAMIGLAQWQSALTLYLLVVLFRTCNNTLFQVLEATLHQAVGQGAFAAVTVSRFAGVLALSLSGKLDLFSLIALEIATDGIGLVLMSAGVWRVSRNGGQSGDAVAERQWLQANRRRILSFGLKGYLQLLIIMPYSGMVNRIVIGSHLATFQVALFGFAQSIFDLMQRYLPAQFFAGMVRPVMAARFSRGHSFGEAEALSNASLKVNLVLIGLAATVVVAGGADLLVAVTNGKYGDQAVGLLLVMCLLIALESWRHILDQLSHTVERYGFLVFSNGVLGASLILGIALLPRLGLIALPAANCAGLVIANVMVLWWLRRTGFRYRHDLAGVVLAMAGAGLGIAVGHVSGALGAAWPMRLLVAVAVYALYVLTVLSPSSSERKILSFIVAARRSA